jgi:hypothetical protein
MMMTSMLMSSCGRLELLQLPLDVLEKVAGCLDLPSIEALGATCRLFCVLCSSVSPGLLLSLYPHQVCQLFSTSLSDMNASSVDQHPFCCFQ